MNVKQMSSTVVGILGGCFMALATPQAEELPDGNAIGTGIEKAPVKTISCPPGTKQFFFVPGRVSGSDLRLVVDFPAGMRLEPAGMINWRFCEGPQFLIPDSVNSSRFEKPGGTYMRYTLSYRPTRASGVKIKPDRNYRLKTRIKSNLAEGEVSLLMRWGDDKGALLRYDGIEQFKGKGEWKDIEHDIKPPSGAGELNIMFNKGAGAMALGSLTVEYMELYEAGTSTQLLDNGDFKKGALRWTGNVADNPKGQGLRLEFKGHQQQGANYSESSPLPKGTEIATAPFFAVEAFAAGDYYVHYHWETLDGKTGTAEERIKVTVRNDELKAPKTLETAVWLAEGPIPGYPPLVRDAVISILKDSLINTIYTEGPAPNLLPYGTKAQDVELEADFIARLADDGFKVIAYVVYENHFFGPLTPGYLQQHPEAAAVDWTGRRRDERVCPTYLFLGADNDYRKLLVDVTERLVRETKLSGIYWDLESNIPMPAPDWMRDRKSPDTVSPGIACFCPRCVDAFRKAYGIEDITRKPENPVTMGDYDYALLPEPAHSIIKNYPLQWTHFVNSQLASAAREVAGAVKRARPSAEFRIYTGFYTKGYFRFKDGGLLRWSEICGASREQTAAFVDVLMGIHDNYFYDEYEAPLVKELSRRIAGRKIPMVLDVSCKTDIGVSTTTSLYPRIMKAFAFSGGDGVAIYQPYVLDSSGYSELRRAFADLAELESFFVEGKQIDKFAELEQGSKTVKVAVWLLGNKRAVFILNEGDKPSEVVLRNKALGPSPGYRQEAYFLHEGKRLDDPANVAFVLPGKSMEILMIEDVSYSFLPQAGM